MAAVNPFPAPALPPARRFSGVAAVLSPLTRLLPLAGACALLSACATVGDVAGGGRASQIIVSVQDQKMTVIREGGGRVTYPISTSKFGLDGRRRSYTTPTGNLAIAQKVGGGAPVGAVFKSRVRTGEIVKVNSPGRDPIVTRILVLRGLDGSNRDAASRGIYIHGTPEERNIGLPVSYGCIRMRSRDVIALYDMVGVGTRVRVLDSTQRGAVLASGVDLRARPPAEVTTAVAAATGRSEPEAAAAAASAGVAASTPVADVGSGTSSSGELGFTDPLPAATAANRPPASRPAAVQVVANTAGSNGRWAGSPGKLLGDPSASSAADAAAPVPARRAPSASGARPVANTAAGDAVPNAGRALNRPALDSL